VLDNAQGSGSTGVAAVLEGRQYVGIDNEARYSAVAIERIREAVNDSPQAI